MKTAIIIPARMGSTRFPAKPLAMLKGAAGDEKSLIARVWEAAIQVEADAHIVATDDARIAAHVESFGGRAELTSQNARNGSERVAELLEYVDAELFVNFQGDAPLIPPDFVERLIGYMKRGSACDVATPVMRCDEDMLSALQADRRAGLVGGTTAAFAKDGRALYFSKEIIPFAGEGADIYLHIGLYAYRRAALASYASLAEGRLEQIEKLEQLRFLENGMRVDCVEVDARGRAFWEVNNPEDVPRVEAALKQRGIK